MGRMLAVERREKPNLRKERYVLLVDDDPIIQEVISRQLATLGYTVDVASDGHEALARWKHDNYALVLTDCYMPVMDGFELAEAIREEEKGKKVLPTPIVAITASDTTEEIERCRSSGMNSCMAKPPSTERLERELLRWTAATKALPVWYHDKAANDQTGRMINLAVLAEYVGNDASLQHRISRKFLDSVFSTVEAIETAMENRNFARIKELAHRVKPSAQAMGAERLTKFTLQLEQAAKEEQEEEIRKQLATLPPMLRQLEKEITALA